MKKTITALVIIATFIALAAPVQAAKKKEAVKAVGGASVGDSGLVFDAGYDPRLDTLVPGYKVINAVIVNHSFDIIELSPEKDVWTIKLDGDRRTHKIVHDMRSQNPSAWAGVPEKARTLLSYPLVVPVGAREVIDLFVPERVDVKKFTELGVYLNSIGTRFDVLVRQ